MDKIQEYIEKITELVYQFGNSSKRDYKIIEEEFELILYIFYKINISINLLTHDKEVVLDETKNKLHFLKDFPMEGLYSYWDDYLWKIEIAVKKYDADLGGHYHYDSAARMRSTVEFYLEWFPENRKNFGNYLQELDDLLNHTWDTDVSDFPNGIPDTHRWWKPL